MKQHSHCSYCGRPFAAEQSWPRQCANCGNRAYRNPLPVGVILLPVGDGLLVVRRNIDPGRGRLALPGGFIELPETWQEAGARELLEETGIPISAEDVELFRVYSAPDDTILIFGLAPQWIGPLPPFDANGESSERVIVTQPCPLAFSLHTRVVDEYFAEKSPQN